MVVGARRRRRIQDSSRKGCGGPFFESERGKISIPLTPSLTRRLDLLTETSEFEPRDEHPFTCVVSTPVLVRSVSLIVSISVPLGSSTIQHHTPYPFGPGPTGPSHHNQRPDVHGNVPGPRHCDWLSPWSQHRLNRDPTTHLGSRLNHTLNLHRPLSVHYLSVFPLPLSSTLLFRRPLPGVPTRPLFLLSVSFPETTTAVTG